MGKLSAFILLLVLVNLSWADVTTTSSPSQDSTVPTLENENVNKLQTTESPVGDSTEESVTENETGPADNFENHTEPAVNVEETTTASGSGDESTVGVEEISKEVTTQSPQCSEPGVHAAENNCQIYHECSVAADGKLQSETKSCPERQAFNSELKRCSRDVSECALNVRCFSKGVLADPNSNTSYYQCQPRFTGSGYYVFHVYCSANEVYNPTYGVCVRDSSSTVSSVVIGANEDALAVRQEIKELKKEYKDSIKAEKQKQKTEKKAIKKEEKEAEKLQKEQEKLQKQARQQEAAKFVCPTEGNFPSKIADNFYIACIYNKNTVIALPIECSAGAIFNAPSGSCVKSESKSEN